MEVAMKMPRLSMKLPAGSGGVPSNPTGLHGKTSYIWPCENSALWSCSLPCRPDVSFCQRASAEIGTQLSFLPFYHNQAPHPNRERRPMESHSTPHGGVPSDPAGSHGNSHRPPSESHEVSHESSWPPTGLPTGSHGTPDGTQWYPMGVPWHILRSRGNLWDAPREKKGIGQNVVNR